MKPTLPSILDVTSAIYIRDAQPADQPTIAQFNQWLAGESEGKQLDPAILSQGVQRALQSPLLCRYFVAELGGEIVGQTMITFELTDWRNGVLWWIQSVYVREDCRAKGVFRALFTHIEALARQSSDVRGLRLYVEHGNHRAQEVYQRLGLKPGGYQVYELDWSGAVGELDANSSES